MTNKEISSLFKLTSQLMDLHGENSFRAKSYANSSFQIGRLDRQISTLDPKDYINLKGVGKSNADKITEILTTGSFPLLEELIEKTPEGLLDILRIKGLGAKKVRTIWIDLGIEDLGELYYACVENRLAKMKGFGEKTQESVKASIEFYQANRKKFLYAKVEEEALDLLYDLNELDTIKLVSFTGSLRRKCDVVESIDFVVAAEKTALLEVISASKNFIDAEPKDDLIHAKSPSGFPVSIYQTDEPHFAVELFRTTGGKKLVNSIEQKIEGTIEGLHSEAEIFSKAGLPLIIPEAREDENEINEVFQDRLKHLIAYEDIKGIIHNHSTYSDGANSIEAMAKACIELGYQYFGINDHSKSAFYAGGLSEAEIVEQHKEVDALNEQLAPFKIFKGIESDILNDGSLDYDDSVLKTFDFIVASVHSNLKMDEEKAMKRLITAIENPYTTILGHMTGRLLLSRPGYPVDHKKVIDACAANKVIIELNANPHRLDIDWRWVGHALDKGVMISVNPDAHSVQGIRDIYFGVCAARKGGLTKDMTLNALAVDEFEALLRQLKP